MNRWIALLLIVMSPFAARSQKVFDFNLLCQQAYTDITRLKLSSGQQLLGKAKKQNPDNLVPQLLDGYVDFFVLFFNEDPAEYKRRKDHFERRLEAIEDGPTASPFYNYCRAVLYMQRAAIGIKFGERISAALDFKRAFTLIKDNRNRFPAFEPNNMVYGPLQVAVGAVPKNYKWAANIFGLKGSINGGMQLMRNFLNSNDQWARLFSNEATFYYCYLKFHLENKPDEVFQYIHTRKLDLVNNHLFTYLAANLGLNNKLSGFARNVILNRNNSAEYLHTNVWDFELGYAELYKLDYADAIAYFERFVKNFRGRFYLKDALQKLSWSYYLQGNMTAAERIRQQLIKSGNIDTDADKKAHKEARSGVWPNILLLKARLLNDGGYHKEALAMLHGKTNKDFPKPEDALEFTYRVARIYDDLGNDDAAINAYHSAIKLGTNRKEYYAARAALQIGFIYEKRGQKATAISFFEKCLSMDDHDYKDSIDQKAKAGIQRCKGQ